MTSEQVVFERNFELEFMIENTSQSALECTEEPSGTLALIHSFDETMNDLIRGEPMLMWLYHVDLDVLFVPHCTISVSYMWF